MELNGQPRTRLIGPNGSFEVFSGTGDSINDPDATDEAGSGPLPTGDYYIVDRPQGGFFGRIFSRLTGRDQWFALYRQDGAVDDVTTVNGVQRSLFRLHAGTISAGCVTVCSPYGFQLLRNELLSSPNGTIPGTSTTYYGTLNVWTRDP